MNECPKCHSCFDDDVKVCPHDSVETRFIFPGRTLLEGRFLLKKRLGSGAMGHVYLAVDQKFTDRKVAVKTIKPDFFSSSSIDEEEIITRFRDEADLAARIGDLHVVSVMDYGKTEDNTYFLVMEYVEGETLQKLLKREGTLTIKRALNLLKQIAKGLEAAHQKGIIHRDLKPSNVFLQKTSDSSGDGYVKIGDFGLAKLKEEYRCDDEFGPRTQGMIGTPEYMAPEQIDARNNKIDERADIYALGTIAYLMIGGRVPFSGSITEIIAKKIMEEPAPLSSLRSDVPKEVEEVIMWALRKNPEERPRSVREWITALEEAAKGVEEQANKGDTKLVVIAPQGAEVYIDDERKGTVGGTGKLIIRGIPIGRHILRISRVGERDDEREIEIRGDIAEQVIQAQLKSLDSGQSKFPEASVRSSLPRIVACERCGTRFAEGVKFCGKCGSSSFRVISGKRDDLTVQCANCKSFLPSAAKFCGKCGAPILVDFYQGTFTSTSSFQQISIFSQRKTCRRCGAAYLHNAKFCGRCGFSLQEY